jgi:hypothetical protein
MTLIIAFICLGGFGSPWYLYIVVFFCYSLSLSLRISRLATQRTRFQALEKQMQNLLMLQGRRQ